MKKLYFIVILVLIGIGSFFNVESFIVSYLSQLSNPDFALFHTIIVSVLTLLISHILSKDIEQEKYEKERLEKLYIPLLNKVLAVIDVKTAYRKKFDIKHNVYPEKITDEIMCYLETNIQYGSPNLVTQFIRYDKQNYLNNYEIDLANEYFINVCMIFIEDVLKINRRINILDKKMKKDLWNYYVLTSIQLMLYRVFNESDYIDKVVENKWKFDEIKYLKFLYIRVIFILLRRKRKNREATNFIVRNIFEKKHCEEYIK